MTTTRCTLVATGMLALALAAFPARALPTDQYLALRRRAAWDPRLTMSVVQSSPAAYVGRALELRGSVDGTIQREGGLSFMLTMEDGSSILLPAPAADTGMVATVNHQRLRVLGRVAENGAPGNIVPLSVLALANDAEVTARERDAEARSAAARQQGTNVTPARSQQPADLASRSAYTVRPMGRGMASVSALAQRYLSPEAQAVYPAYRAFIIRHNRRLTEDELDQITVSILYFSQRHRVDPRLVVAMIIAESDFNPRSTSSKGAMGLGQIMPDEARDHGLTNPYDPIQNVRAAVNLLKMKLNLFSEPGSQEGFPTVSQVVKALAAYNAGAGAVKRYGGVPPYRETQGYVRKIMQLYREFCGG